MIFQVKRAKQSDILGKILTISANYIQILFLAVKSKTDEDLPTSVLLQRIKVSPVANAVPDNIPGKRGKLVRKRRRRKKKIVDNDSDGRLNIFVTPASVTDNVYFTPLWTAKRCDPRSRRPSPHPHPP